MITITVTVTITVTITVAITIAITITIYIVCWNSICCVYTYITLTIAIALTITIAITNTYYYHHYHAAPPGRKNKYSSKVNQRFCSWKSKHRSLAITFNKYKATSTTHQDVTWSSA